LGHKSKFSEPSSFLPSFASPGQLLKDQLLPVFQAVLLENNKIK